MPAAHFSEARSRFLIEQLQLQVDLGKRAESGFKKEAWEAVTESFNDHFQTKFTREQLKNHFQGLKTSLIIVRKLKNLSGFGLDPATGTLTASPSVWNEVIQANPKARPFRDRPFILFDVLDTLVGTSAATGDRRRSAKRSHSTLTAEEQALDDWHEDDVLPDATDLLSEPRAKVPRIDTSSEQSTSDSVDIEKPTTSAPLKLQRTDSMPTHHGLPAESSTSNVPDDTKDSKASRRNSRRSRANGTLALAESLGAVVNLEKTRSTAPAPPTVFVKEKHADMKKAIAIYTEESAEFITDVEQLHVGVMVLRKESDAAFFLACNKKMRWDWMLREIEFLIEAE